MLTSGYIQVLAAMLIWGSVGVFVRYAGQPADVIVFVRVASAFFAIGIYMLFTKKAFKFPRLRWLIASGVAIALNWLFFFKSIQATTIGNAVFTYYLAPVFSIIWARLFIGENLERRAIKAMGLAAIGLLLMLSGYEFSLTSNDTLGIIYGLTGGLFYSIVVVLVKYLDDVPPLNVVLVQMAVSALIFLPTVIQAKPAFTLTGLSAMLTMGLVHSAFALGLYFTGLSKVKVQHASILSYIDPVSALLFAYLFFGEIPSLYTLAGGSLILLASVLIIRRPQSTADINN